MAATTKETIHAAAIVCPSQDREGRDKSAMLSVDPPGPLLVVVRLRELTPARLALNAWAEAACVGVHCHVALVVGWHVVMLGPDGAIRTCPRPEAARVRMKRRICFVARRQQVVLRSRLTVRTDARPAAVCVGLQEDPGREHSDLRQRDRVPAGRQHRAAGARRSGDPVPGQTLRALRATERDIERSIFQRWAYCTSGLLRPAHSRSGEE